MLHRGLPGGLPGGLHHMLKCVPCCITITLLRRMPPCLLRRCAASAAHRGILTASQGERMSRKAPRAALPKPKMHPPGLAITGGYTATTTL